MAITLTFDGVNLTLVDGGVPVQSWVGISGAADTQNPTPKAQAEYLRGPTPEGQWRIDVVKTTDNVGLQNYGGDEWGGIRWRINSAGGIEQYLGRDPGTFYLHANTNGDFFPVAA